MHHLVAQEFHMETGELHTVPACPGTKPMVMVGSEKRKNLMTLPCIKTHVEFGTLSLSLIHT